MVSASMLRRRGCACPWGAPTWGLARPVMMRMSSVIFLDRRAPVVLTPTAPSAAFPLNEKQDDPIKMYLNDIFTVPASLAGIPGISIPYGSDKNGLPLGIQLLSKHFNEQEILNAAFALEKDYE